MVKSLKVKITITNYDFDTKKHMNAELTREH